MNIRELSGYSSDPETICLKISGDDAGKFLQGQFSNDINLLEDTSEDICQSGFKFITGLNKQEVVVVPKKQIKQGFFEKFFHFFR